MFTSYIVNSDEKDKLSRLLNNIAIIYRYQEAYDKAIAAYDESLELKRVILDSAGIAATLMNMGILYSYTDEMETAVNHLREAKVLYQNLGQVAGLAECTNALGVIYYNLGRFPEAKEQFNIANQYYKENPFPWAQAGTLFSLGSIALVEKEYALSEEYLKKAIEMSEKANRWGEKFDVFLKLSQAQHALGKNREAYQALQIAYELQDSIKEDRKMQLIEENQAHFEVLQKEKALAINQLALEKSNRERNSLIWGILLLFLLGIGLGSFLLPTYPYRKAKNSLATAAYPTTRTGEAISRTKCGSRRGRKRTIAYRCRFTRRIRWLADRHKISFFPIIEIDPKSRSF